MKENISIFLRCNFIENGLLDREALYQSFDLTTTSTIIILIIFILIGILARIYYLDLRHQKDENLVTRVLAGFIVGQGYVEVPPIHGLVTPMYSLGVRVKLFKDGSIIGYQLMRLYEEGVVDVIKDEQNPKIVVKAMKSCKLEKEEVLLYDLLNQIADKNNEITLSVARSSSNQNKVLNQIEATMEIGKEFLLEDRYVRTWPKHVMIDHFSGGGLDEIRNIIGYKKYLDRIMGLHKIKLDDILPWQMHIKNGILYGIEEYLGSQLAFLRSDIRPEVKNYCEVVQIMIMFNRVMHKPRFSQHIINTYSGLSHSVLGVQ